MGAFLVNFHVRGKSIKQVSKSLNDIPIEEGWICGKQSKWVSFWERDASEQNPDRIQRIAQSVSQATKATVLAFLVHDSDVTCYWLYKAGKQLDEYNSFPSYWGDDSVDEGPLSADCKLLTQFCEPGTDPATVEAILSQRTRADIANGSTSPFTPAEERLVKLAPLLGLPEIRLLTDFNDIGREIQPDELGATWIGTGPQRPGETGHEDFDDDDSERLLPASSLYEAAARNELEAIEKLIANGADVNQISHGFTVTALGLAASQSTSATIRKLVELGADLQKKGKEGATPLRLAIQASQPDNARTLVESGADINEYDAQFGTLLHVAVMQASWRAISVLIELGIDTQRPNSKGLTPLHCVQLQLDGIKQLQSMLGGANVPAMNTHVQTLEELEKLLSR